MTASENIVQWFRVPANATLELSITGKTATDVHFVATARCLPNVGPEEIWWDHELNPGPRTHVVNEDTSYVVRVVVKFLAESTETAVVTGQVFNPDGSVRKDWAGRNKYIHELSGKQGQPPGRATLLVIED